MRALAVLLFLAACSEPPAQDEQAMFDPLTVKTYQGAVQGRWAEATQSIRVFWGLPYAKPPLAALRFRPPEAPRTWSGVRDASTPSPACWQPINFDDFVWSRGQFNRSEDCLYLNVWADKEATDQAVMVWFHGGAHTAGMGHDKIFDGTELAKQGVVLVTLNYRLGPFGFLAHPALAQESSQGSAGNYGLMDKIAALNWVRDNISQFGGDPDNVTIFGQSAGSQSVCALMASPLAQGLFHKAIGQSASCLNPMPAADANGFERGSRLAAALHADDSVEALRQVAPEDLLAAVEQTQWDAQSRIVVDGWVLPEQPDAIYRASKQAAVPLLVGSLANEGIELIPLDQDLSTDALQAYATKIAGGEATDLMVLYAGEASQSPGLAQREISTDLFVTYGMRRWAGHQHRTGAPTYLYFMDHVPPAFRLYMPDQPDMSLPGGPRSAGAYHSGDLAYVFGNVDKVGLDWRDDDREVSRLITSYWTNFAKTGNPNSAALPAWRAYDPLKHATQLLRPDAHTVDGVRRAKLDLWDRRFGNQ